MNEVNGKTSPALNDVPDLQDAQSLLEKKADPGVPRDEWARVRELALAHLGRLMSLEPKVLRGDDPDAIHDMRVASRRLQQALDLLYLRPRPGEVRRCHRRMRRCRRALGEVRNCDVLLQRSEKLLARKRTARREVWAAVRDYLVERRAQSFQKALRRLAQLNLAVFYLYLNESLTSNGAAPPLPASQAIAAPVKAPTEPFHERVVPALGRAWKGFENQVSISHRDPRAPVIHQVRIATKRLRYLIEVIHEFNVSGSAEALAWLRRLQQHLGDWHDLEVLEQIMIEMVARPEFLRDHLHLAMGVESLVLGNRTTKRVYEEEYLKMTRDSVELTRLKEWLSYVLAFPSAAFTKV